MVNFELRGGGFAPRHLNRSALCVILDAIVIMIKKYILALALFLPVFANVNLAQATKSPIFRTITVGAGDRTLLLGGEISEIQDLLVKTETGYTLKPEAFGSAKTINLILSKANRVRAIFFEYDTDKNFEKTVASYTQSLGKPLARQTFASQSLQVEVVAWEDTETRFELVKRTEQEKIFIISALFDKKSASK